MIGGTSGVDLIGFVVYAVAAGTVYGLFTLIWRAGHTRGRLEAELACCQNKQPNDSNHGPTPPASDFLGLSDWDSPEDSVYDTPKIEP